MKLNKSELATILHGLRQTQREILDGVKLDGLLHFAPPDKPLSLGQIDDLCERLNLDVPLGLYCVTVTKVDPTRREFITLVERAASHKDAKKAAVDVLNEMWPKRGQRFSKMSGVRVELSVDELVESESGPGYCYPVLRAAHVYHYTFS
jgi:hypothetical protein